MAGASREALAVGDLPWGQAPPELSTAAAGTGGRRLGIPPVPEGQGWCWEKLDVPGALGLFWGASWHCVLRGRRC